MTEQVQTLFSDVSNILTAPFVGQLDLLHLFLLIGVVLVFLIAWGIILNHIQMAASEI